MAILFVGNFVDSTMLKIVATKFYIENHVENKVFYKKIFSITLGSKENSNDK